MEYEQDPVAETSNNVFRKTVIAVIVLYVLGSAYFLYSLGSRLNKVEADQKAAIQTVEQSNKILMDRSACTRSPMASSAALSGTTISSVRCRGSRPILASARSSSRDRSRGP